MINREAIEKAAHIFALACAEPDALPPRLAAEAAWYSGGPSVDEIEAKIREMRGLPPADTEERT
ncbi:hypothetical protein [Prauserella flavalba]|uniref:Uncharacterized protein n=1 Tax=Prauserella flavalba TaxID=1477506 RepID=A0A318LLG4_9PSEU|nr:hypothetical protein [Prauserella flavalba]PXY16716.1 hypothetical protein BA062_38645 [Prauserella flavalba]